MKKILHIIYGFNNGGVEKVLLNYIDSNKYDVTIMYFLDSDINCIKQYKNIKIIKNPYTLNDKYHFYKYLFNYLKENNFDIVHSHINKYNYLTLKCAYKRKVKTRISHAHGIDQKTHNIVKKIYRYFLKKGIKKYATKLVACSESSGKDLYFNEPFLTIYNPINIEQYKFNEHDRKNVRKQYNIKNDKIILGTVGRFSYLKNHQFLFKLLKELDEKYILMMVGDGELKEEYLEDIKTLYLEDRVIFAGVTDNVSKYLSAMDIFLFPSITEGFGISLIESQANGLYTIASNTLSQETKISDQIKFLDINDIEVWKKEILVKRERLNHKLIGINKFNIQKNRQIFNKLYE